MKTRFTVAVTAFVLACAIGAVSTQKAKAEGLSPGLKWIETEKIRALSYYQHFSDPKQQEEFVKKAQSLGFNTFLLGLGDKMEVDDSVRDTLALAGKYRMHIIWTFFLTGGLGNPEVRAATSRSFVGEDGVKHSDWECPFDEKYWDAVLERRAISLAKAAKEYPAAAAVHFDLEDYGGTRVWNGHCYCDDCFDSFAQAEGLSVTHDTVPAAQRKAWLTSNGLFDKYTAHQHAEIVRICRNIRQKIDEINPDLLVGWYDDLYYWIWGDNKYGAFYSEDIDRGFGTERSPIIVMPEYTYAGYMPDCVWRVKEAESRGLHILFLPGIATFEGVDLGPLRTAAGCYYAATQNAGYWLYDATNPILMGITQWANHYVPGTAEQWEKWMKFGNEELDRWLKNPGYKSSLPLLRDTTLDRRGISEHKLHPLSHSPGTEIRFQKLVDMGSPWAGKETLLKGQKVGDYLEFPVSVAVADDYVIYVFAPVGPTRGIVQLEVDGKPVGESIDLYNPDLRAFFNDPDIWWERFGGATQVGKTTLSADTHTFRLQIVGKNKASSGFDVGLRGLQLKAVSDAPFVRNWKVIGPFPWGDYRGLRWQFPPEKELDFSKVYEGLDGTEVSWKDAQSNADGWLDLRKAIGVPTGTAYALAIVNASKDCVVNLRLSQEGGTRVWVNGEMVWKNEIQHRLRLDADQLPVHLVAGVNKVLVKIEQQGAEEKVEGKKPNSWLWGLYLRFSGGPAQLTN